MSFLAWNCQGALKSSARQRISKLIRLHKPDLLFLSETIAASADAISKLQNSLGFTHSFAVPSVGRSGGLAVLWNSHLKVDILVAHQSLIHLQITQPSKPTPWLLSCIYGPPNPMTRANFWQEFSSMVSPTHLPWLLFGDFNEVICQEEKKGGRPFRNSQAAVFLEFMALFGLLDLGFKGIPFTWTNRQDAQDVIFERLDRALSNAAWLQQHPHSLVTHLTRIASDHAPILLEEKVLIKPRVKRFQVEHSWFLHPHCKQVVASAWAEGQNQNPGINILLKADSTATALQQWDRRTFGNLPTLIQGAEEQIRLSQQHAATASGQDLIYWLQKEEEFRNTHTMLSECHATFWRQRSRVEWLQQGDLNTTFFHTKATIRRRHNYIRSILSDSGTWLFEPQQIADSIVQHFHNQYNAPDTTIDHSLFTCVSNRISARQSASLLQPLSQQEVKDALFSIGSEKAPGPDGFTSKFYSLFWDITGAQIFEMASHFFLHNELHEAINRTHIVLIPKNDNPTSPDHFRPIGLCNVIYKVISKILVARLRQILPFVISPFQSAFVPERSIQENIAMAAELFHFIRTSTPSNAQPKIALKLDIKKAYDSLDWNFIRHTLQYMGFPGQFVEYIMLCVTSVSYSIIINGAPHGNFQPKRGLRQGDPLSPYIFILCAEVLSANLAVLQSSQRIRGIRICRNAPEITHLMYADDLLLSITADTNTCSALNNLLAMYSSSAGQYINRTKSIIIHHPKLSLEHIQELQSSFHMATTHIIPVYLGVQLPNGRSTSTNYSELINRYERKTRGWMSKCLNPAGRLTLINTSLTPTANHIMQTQLLPDKVHKKIDQITRNFFWGHDGTVRKLHTLNWRKITQPRKRGGLSIRKSKEHNKALMMKRVWQLHQQKDTLWSTLCHTRYLKDMSTLPALPKPPSTASPLWKGLVKVSPFLHEHSFSVIGNGEKTAVTDKWIPLQSATEARNNSLLPGFSVASLILQETGSWNHHLVFQLFPEDTAQRILAIHLPHQGQEDKIIWPFTSSGQYSVKTGYQNLIDQDCDSTPIIDPQTAELSRRIWKFSCPYKIRLFLWKAIHEAIPTFDVLNARNVLDSGICTTCYDFRETTNHLFFKCSFAAEVWQLLWNFMLQSLNPMMTNLVQPFTLPGMLRICVPEPQQNLLLFTMWHIWLARNDRLYKRVTHPPGQIFQLILVLWREFEWARTHIIPFLPDLPPTQLHPVSRSTITIQIAWQPPQHDWIKINMDGASKGNPGAAGIGVIARNADGNLLQAMAVTLGISTAITAVLGPFNGGEDDLTTRMEQSLA